MNNKPLTPFPLFAVVVNDNSTHLALLAEVVRKAGIEPRPFTTADAALADMSACAKAAANHPGALPAFVVTDLYMPGIDGWRFCRLLRSPEYASLNKIPILIISATYSTDEASRIAADLGAEAFLPSPVDVKQFVDLVQNILSGKRTHNPLRVLIVEDDTTEASALKRSFNAIGYEADMAHTARAATDAFANADYDLALLDYHLPDGPGDDLLDAFLAERPNCVCLMMTGDTSPELALNWMKRGASAYLHKPFRSDYLIELCTRARRERALLRVQDMLEMRTRELHESEDRHRLILQTAMDGFWMTDTQGQLLEVNEIYCRMSGYCEQELLSMRISDIEVADTADDIDARIQKIKTQREDRFESRHRRKDGSIIDVEVSVQYRPTQGGRLVSFLQDITERKQAEAALQESNTYLENLINYANVPIIVWDTDYHITRFNHAFEMLTGKTSGSVLGKSIELLFPQDMVDSSMNLIRSTMEGKRWDTVNISILHADGSKKEVLWNSANILSTDGSTVVSTIAQGFDITQLKIFEERTRQQQKQLVQADKMASLGVLVSGVAHEINNPNNLVMFNSDLVGRIVSDVKPILDDYYHEHPESLLGGLSYNETRKELESLLNGISIGSQRIRDIVAGLKDFARVDSGDMNQQIHVNEIVKSALLIVGNLIMKSTEAFSVEYADDIPVIRGNPQQMEQVFINLITNACHALKNSAQAIRIQTAYRSTDSKVRVVVSDEGVGIPKEHMERLFDPFFTTKRVAGGTGLGLSISYSIVRAHKGDLIVQSIEGTGTTVTLILPSSAPEETQ